MKLEKFSKNKKQKKIIIGTIVGLTFLVGGITLYRTFALYEEKKEFNVLRGRVPNFLTGDVTIAAIIDGTASNTIPSKTDRYVFESVTCTNGAEAEWNSDTWKIMIGNLSSSRTTCTISFRTASYLIDYITGIAKTSEELVYDETNDNNLRYIGADPNNYVSFNGELWRIIGVMNNIKDSEGNTGSHIKLIRNESLGEYSWDNKPSGTGSSTSEYGSNHWTDSVIMNILNNGVYWNRGSGTCPYNKNGATTACDFTSTGLTKEAKNMIANVVWNIGGLSTYNDATTSMFYTAERGTLKYNDSVKTEWNGFAALMYPSDYGYATSGGETTTRNTCLNTPLYSWNGSNVSDCKNNDWLYSSGTYQWSLMPESSYTSNAFRFYGDGHVQSAVVPTRAHIRPTLYLSTDVEITGNGDGSQENPYQLKFHS